MMTRPVSTEGEAHSLKFFSPSAKICWT